LEEEAPPPASPGAARTGRISWWQFFLQLFTRRAVPAALPETPLIREAAAPAAQANPEAATLTVSTPRIIEAEPASWEAANAGYKTATVIMGGTPLRVYAKDERILHEIRGILSQPGLLSEKAIVAQYAESLGRLGFEDADTIAGAFVRKGNWH
jgi:hypothetical protein